MTISKKKRNVKQRIIDAKQDFIKKKIPFPKHVLIEITSYCNRDCHFCPRSTDTSGYRKYIDGTKVNKQMPTEKVIDVLDQLVDLKFTGSVAFHFHSESFSDSRMIYFCEQAKKRGFKVALFTNGDYLKNDSELCRKTVEVADNICVGLYDVPDNKEDLSQAKREWRNKLNGIPIIKFSYAAQKPTYRYYANNKVKLKSLKTNRCRHPLTRFLINYNGNVSFCCEDARYDFSIGNIFKTSIKEIWWSEKNIKMLNDVAMGIINDDSICLKCNRGDK
jgi:radical SAM protein with 4Fe4S-binding SPASM domain